MGVCRPSLLAPEGPGCAGTGLEFESVPVFHLSLRLRLVLAFMTMVALLVGVGIVSYRTQSRMQAQVEVLRPSAYVDLTRQDLEHVGLEVEGHWDPAGAFIATDVEVIPASPRPRLRGPVQAVDTTGEVVQLYGVPIHLLENTELSDNEADLRGASGLSGLSIEVGQRIEVTCEVTDGVWYARKLRTKDIKASDKIKGKATSWEVDGITPEMLEFHGLSVSLGIDPANAAESALGDLRAATQLMVALQECRAAAHMAAAQAGQVEAAQGLQRAHDDFVHYLFSSLSYDAPEGSLSNRWLEPVADRLPPLAERVEELIVLANSDPDAARAYLADDFSPFMEEEIEPRLTAYLSRSEEELGDQLRAIAAQGATTTRVALATSVVAALLAIVLGLLVWRSIHRPLRDLQTAAVELGHGRLDTRVEVRARDELGELAEAFNRMASELSSTTLSIGNLENVFDSMAGSLLLLDPSLRITSVNRAGLELLGRQQQDLVGQPFQALCPSGLDVSDLPLALSEGTLLRSDGVEVPVALSAAELRAGEDSVRGYVCVAQDLTERKRIEAQVRRSLAEKELLLREVHHRVKNNMQVISSLLAMQAVGTTDPSIAERFEQSQARIRSMALIHEQLYQAPDLAQIDLRLYLDVLVSHLLQSYGREGAVRIVQDVDGSVLDVDQSLACGLIVNELVVNALKHAYANGAQGTIRVSLRAVSNGQLALTVSDDGPGIDPTHSVREGALGMSLVTTLADQLGGNVEVTNNAGCEVRVLFPLQLAEARVG